MEGMMETRVPGEKVLELAGGSESLWIVAPFIKQGAFEKIMGVIEKECEVTVYTRWHAREVAAGVSDLEVFQVAERVGGEVFLHPRLHAKAFLNQQRGLIGSSNVTYQGLGWGSSSAVELLTQVDRENPDLIAMLSRLRATSCRATEYIQREIESQAEKIPGDSRLRGPGFWDKDREGLGEEHFHGVPRYNVPESVWPAYRGWRADEVVELVRRDLEALGVPEGIKDEDEFNAVVGAALTQGVTGRLIQECSDVNAVDAAGRFRETLQEVGVELPDGKLGEYYQSFVRWVSHFVSGRTLRATGFSLG